MCFLHAKGLWERSGLCCWKRHIKYFHVVLYLENKIPIVLIIQITENKLRELFWFGEDTQVT